MGLPPKQGLYDPRNEHDACGVGFVANIKGAKSHDIIGLGLQLLINLDHRGAVGADPLVGDGAGILIQIPDPLFRDWARSAGVTLPAPGKYAVAMCFLPREAKAREIVVKQFEHFIKVEGQKLLGWRDVPTDPAGLGKTVLDGMPLIRQAIIAAGPHIRDADHFERKLLVIRKQAQNPLAALAKKHKLPAINQLYLPSLSTRTVVYKGLLLAHDVGRFYKDLQNPLTVSAVALVHQRFSPTPSQAGSWRIPIAISPITARSTPCAATSTGSMRAAAAWNPNCWDLTWTRCGRSSRTASPTRRVWTMRWSCWWRAAIRWPMR